MPCVVFFLQMIILLSSYIKKNWLFFIYILPLRLVSCASYPWSFFFHCRIHDSHRHCKIHFSSLTTTVSFRQQSHIWREFCFLSLALMPWFIPEKNIYFLLNSNEKAPENDNNNMNKTLIKPLKCAFMYVETLTGRRWNRSEAKRTGNQPSDMIALNVPPLQHFLSWLPVKSERAERMLVYCINVRVPLPDSKIAREEKKTSFSFYVFACEYEWVKETHFFPISETKSKEKRNDLHIILNDDGNYFSHFYMGFWFIFKLFSVKMFFGCLHYVKTVK